MSAHVYARTGLALALFAATAAHATNGYLPHGYGVKSKGMAGVTAALPQDALVIATNPAGLGAVGNRVDVGVELFMPRRQSTIEGNAFGPDQEFSADGTNTFVIPEFGYSHELNDSVTLGVAVFGNGGMNTDYLKNPYARYGSTGTAYMNLEQLFIAPAVSWQVSERHTVGAALNLAYQRFEMKGLSAFAPFSADAANLTDNGVDTSTGAGIRLGWTGELTDAITVGASWQSKTRMSEFDKYAGLFAEQGDFDIPENYVLGVAIKASEDVTIGVDWQTIRYSEVAAVGNRVNQLWTGNMLGADKGPGFGWNDIRVVKIGAAWKTSETFTLRAGFSTVDRQPIPQEETFFNIIAPGVIRDHLTVGGTWAIGEKNELSFEYAHAFENTVEGNGSIPPGMPPGGLGGGEANLRMYEDMVGVAWARKL